jgi:hypothetical protein
MSARTAGIAKAFVASALLVALGWWIAPEGFFRSLLGAPRIESSPRLAAGDRSRDDPLPDPAHGGSIPAERAVELAPQDFVGGKNVVQLPQSGKVSMRVLDARSGEPLGAVSVRFLSEKRFAAYDGAGELEVLLTSGNWEANVTAAGFEPAHVGPFEIQPALGTTLEPVALSQGSGAIEGRVIARHLAPDAPVIVQLHGAGRARCVDCAESRSEERCASCGFLADRSELELQAGDGRFRFGHLATGTYWLRAFEPAQRIVASQRIEITRGGSGWAQLDVTPPTLARFELRHDSRFRTGPFTGDWRGVHRERPAPIRFQFRREGKVVAEAEIGPSAEEVRATMGAPIFPIAPKREERGGISATLSWGTSLQVSGRLRSYTIDAWGNLVLAPDDGRIDRERQEGDALAFDSPEPDVSGAAVGLARPFADRPHLVEAKPLPRMLLSVVVTCGHYTSDEVPVDLRSDPFGPIVVALFPTEDWVAKLAEFDKPVPESCKACHDPEKPPEEEGMTISFDGQSFFNSGDGVFIEGSTIELPLKIDLGDAKPSDGN